MAFGELFMWKRGPLTGEMAKTTGLWEEGVFLGGKATSGEYRVGWQKGVVKTRGIARRPAEERWAPKVLDMVGGVPWLLSEDDPEMDGEPMRMQVSREGELRMSAEEEVQSAPRCICIKRGDLEKLVN